MQCFQLFFPIQKIERLAVIDHIITVPAIVFHWKYLPVPVFQTPLFRHTFAAVQRLMNTSCCYHHGITSIDQLNTVCRRDFFQFSGIQFQRIRLPDSSCISPVFSAPFIKGIDIMIGYHPFQQVIFLQKCIFFQIPDHISVCIKFFPEIQSLLVAFSGLFPEYNRQHHICFHSFCMNLPDVLLQMVFQRLCFKINRFHTRFFTVFLHIR